VNVITVYVKLYAQCLAETVRGLRKSPWTLLLPLGMSLAMQLLASLRSIPFLGGIILSGLLSCYLYFLGEVVRGMRVSLRELRVSIGKYLWSVLAVVFVLWVAQFLLAMALPRTPNAALFFRFFNLAAFILLNAVPEVLYLRGIHGGLATFERSFRFIQENWLEWFIPNLPLLALAWFGVDLVGLLFAFVPSLNPIALMLVAAFGALFHTFMVFRGHLFEALDGSSHRQRMYRSRMGG